MLLNDIVFAYEVAYADLFTSLIGDARVIFWMLTAIDFTWSLIVWASRDRGAGFLEAFAGRLMFILVFGVIFLESYPSTIGNIPRLFLDAGAQVTGGDTFLNPETVVADGIALIQRLEAGTTNISIFSLPGMLIRGLAILAMLVAFATIAIKVTKTLAEQYLVLGMGVLLFGFAGARWTWPLAEGVIRYAVNVGIRLLLLMLLFDVGKTFIEVWAMNLESSAWLDFRPFLELLIAPLAFAYLVWTVPDRLADTVTSRFELRSPFYA